MEILLEKITDFLGHLDWVYMLSLIVISYILNKGADSLPFSKIKTLITRPSKMLRSFLLGIVWMWCIFQFRGYKLEADHGKHYLEWMIVSLFFAMLMYQAVVKVLLDKLSEKVRG